MAPCLVFFRHLPSSWSYPVKDGESTPWRQDEEMTRAPLFLSSSLVAAQFARLLTVGTSIAVLNCKHTHHHILIADALNAAHNAQIYP